MTKLMLIFAVALLNTNAYAVGSADDAFNPTTTTTTTTTGTAPTPNQTQFPTYVPPPPPPPKPLPVSQGSINPAANQGKQSQDSGSGANAAAGAALIAAGMALMANPPTQPAGAALVAMGMLALAQSGHDSGAADQSAATAAASYNGVNNPGATNAAPTNPDLGNGKGGFNNPAAKDGLKALHDAGYDINKNGLVNPDGTTTPNSAFNSPGGLAATGMSPDNVKAVGDALGNVNKDIYANGPKVSAVAVAEGGGGAGGADPHPGQDFSLSGKGSRWGLSGAQKAAMVAGKTVNFDGEPIGVRGSNIFDMIHVAYDKKRNANDFIDEGGTAPGPALRSPASVAPVQTAPVKTYAVPKGASAPRPVINNR